MSGLTVVEICAGAGGQALGLERAGFDHALAVEIDPNAARTLRHNRDWKVAVGDVADRSVWNPADFEGVDLLAGGVPCPPFSIAGKQLGALDERDLFAWAVELLPVVKPRALLLENVRGLATKRFAGYREHVLDRLEELGYRAAWRLMQASDYGVPQLRPRFVLVALLADEADAFRWPEPTPTMMTVGSVLHDYMAAGGWRHADAWSRNANRVAPTIVGGSKRHGGADLGPTRAKAAWAALGVDGKGIADSAPPRQAVKGHVPRLTIEMVARLQGWTAADDWTFTGLKTSRYRQVGNAFPPPVAEIVGTAIRSVLLRDRPLAAMAVSQSISVSRDPVYSMLKATDGYVPLSRLVEAAGPGAEVSVTMGRIQEISLDFVVDVRESQEGPEFRLAGFRGFVGQDDHVRHDFLADKRSRVS